MVLSKEQCFIKIHFGSQADNLLSLIAGFGGKDLATEGFYKHSIQLSAIVPKI